MLKFIDLFAGLGGFHKALHELGHECVFASEIDPELCQLYFQNFGIKPYGDIRDIDKELDLIPDHDILCAGFPCQPFSMAGDQLGRDDEKSGTLFSYIYKILRLRKPKYFILENVPHLRQHDNEATWNLMYKLLTRLGYQVSEEFYSPHQFGIPQHRKRIFIVGCLSGLDHFSWMKPTLIETNAKSIIEYNPVYVKKIGNKDREILNIWQEFITALPVETKLPGFPMWSMEFGATYPYSGIAPRKIHATELGNFRGNFGKKLNGLKKNEQLKMLPSYARTSKKFPDWKQMYILKNREFYNENKKYLKDIVRKISDFKYQSFQKLEWNVGESDRKIYNYIIQFRPSGVRIKNTNSFPSLVCPTSQIPIIGWLERYITKSEAAKLQSLDGLTLPKKDNTAFKALGNAVNAKIITLIAENLIREETDKLIKQPEVTIAHHYEAT